MHSQLCFTFNPSLCLGCKTCELACLANHNWPRPFRSLHKVQGVDNGLYYFYHLSIGCNHCEDPECLKACNEQAFYKRRDGIVLHDTGKCRGCRDCIKVCPFDAPQFNPVLGIVDKCDMCVRRLEKRLKPYCVEACPTNALDINWLFDADDKQLIKKFADFTEIELTRPAIRFYEPKNQLQRTLSREEEK